LIETGAETIIEESIKKNLLSEDQELEKLKFFAGLQQTEVSTHWTRNNYFLLISSILLVALSQFKTQIVQILIGFLGLSLNISWLLIQYESNRIIRNWNELMANQGHKLGFPEFYPAAGRKIPIRKISTFIPIPFIVLWVAVVILAVLNKVIPT
jgi:hypothetical protein